MKISRFYPPIISADKIGRLSSALAVYLYRTVFYNNSCCLVLSVCLTVVHAKPVIIFVKLYKIQTWLLHVANRKQDIFIDC